MALDCGLGVFMRILTRREAIDDPRRRLSRLVDDEHSICKVAGARGIFCCGFSRMIDDELNARCDWLVRRQKPATREDLTDR